MCDVVSALAIAATVASTYQQERVASAQTKQNFRQADYARDARDANIDQANLAANQDSENAAQKLAQIRREGAQARATARVASGEAGVAGLSVDALLRDLSGQQSLSESAVNTNLMRGAQASEVDRRNISTQTNSTIAGLKTPLQPDYLGAALSIGTTGAAAYQKRYGTQPTPVR